jgi:hypothetical protein
MRLVSNRRAGSRLGRALVVAAALIAGGCLYAEAGVAVGPPVPVATVYVQSGWSYAQIGGVWYYVPREYVVYEQEGRRGRGRGRGHARGHWRGNRRPPQGYVLRGDAWVILR